MENLLEQKALQSSEIYPSVEELMPVPLAAVIPQSLSEEIRERYLTLGAKYMTKDRYKDGRYINAMMNTSRIQNCREEIVDAVFCVLGWIFKAQAVNQQPSDSAWAALRGLIDIYSLLVSEYENDQNI